MNSLYHISLWEIILMSTLSLLGIIGIFLYTRLHLSKNGNSIRFKSLNANISELKKAESLFRSLIENNYDAIILSDINGFPIYQNPSVGKMLGWTSEERKMQNSAEIIHPDEIELVKTKMKEALENPGNAIYSAYRIRHKKGHYIYVEGSITNMLNDGNINALVSNFRDVTKHRENEEQIEFDRNNLSSLINNTNDLMWSVDKDLKLITSNNAFDKTMAQQSGNAIVKGGDILAEGFSKEQSNRFKIFYERALSGEAFTEIEYVDFPEEFWSEISFYPVRKDESVVGTACFSRNVTELKKSVKETLDMVEILQNKNKDLHQFSNIVSHNLRSPIAKIQGLASLFKTDPHQQIKGKSILECVEDEVNNLDNVVKDMYAIISVRDQVEKQKAYICFQTELQFIKQVLENQIIESKANITADFEKTEGIVSIKSYIYSIMLNLLSNAIKYRQPDIPLSIHISCTEDDKNIYLTVQDNGSGIDLQKNKDKIFGLYKRFHGNNIEGRGIGLNLVKAQAESLGGRIEVESAVNQGTTFKVCLPKNNI